MGAAYICRQMAKSVVKSGLCKRALVQLSYAIGVAKPLSLFVETYGTEQGHLTPDDITNIIKISFDCRPGASADSDNEIKNESLEKTKLSSEMESSNDLSSE